MKTINQEEIEILNSTRNAHSGSNSAFNGKIISRGSCKGFKFKITKQYKQLN
jgi:hypothetical protein